MKGSLRWWAEELIWMKKHMGGRMSLRASVKKTLK